MNPRNSIWRDAYAVNAYAARCQSILQSGAPDNDILLYWNISDFWMQPGDKLLPHLTVHARDWFEGQPIGRTAKELWELGYAFDYVSDMQLKTAKVLDGKIQMPGGNYKVIVVPECKYIPLETFKQLLALAKSGAKITFQEQLPMAVSGANNLKKQNAEFQQATNLLHFSHAYPTKAGLQEFPNAPQMLKAEIGNGEIRISKLDVMISTYDIGVVCEQMTHSGLSYVRRSFNGGWNYFIANRTETNIDGSVMLGRSAKSVVILDPMTGNYGVATVQQTSGFGLPLVHLQLAAGESVILRAFADKKVEGPAWIYWQPQTPDAKPQTLTGPWNVKFILGGPTLPADFQTARLASWTTFPDKNTQTFAGTAKYETTFDAPKLESNLQVAPDTLKRELQPCFLDLGDVRQSARVKVNGKDYGTLITPPFRVVVDNLKPTGNTLEVEVTSVAANRIRDLDRRGVPWKTFRDINIVDINYKPFDASNWPLTDCGLLGPVTLTSVTPAK